VGKPIGLYAQFFVGTTGGSLLSFALALTLTLRNLFAPNNGCGGEGFIVVRTTFNDCVFKGTFSKGCD
jgi:hypothetical protein